MIDDGIDRGTGGLIDWGTRRFLKLVEGERASISKLFYSKRLPTNRWI